ncbi:hypothetical protein BCD48_27225 [Pseudofrankia sp. BMG5.36]|nr:hypothetical protein BCD48_27225 [Pseudofrankia sp. BMG5.36]
MKVLHGSPDGSEVLVAIRGDGDVVGEVAAWSPERNRRVGQRGDVPAERATAQRPPAQRTQAARDTMFSDRTRGSGAWRAGRRRTASVEALDRCVAHRIETATFTRFLDEHDALGVFTEYLLDRIAQSVQDQARVTLQPAGQRIAWLLVETFELAGLELADPRRIPFSQAGIAAALGLARSTVAENLRRLRTAGALGSGPRILVTDPVALRRVASDQADRLDG